MASQINGTVFEQLVLANIKNLSELHNTGQCRFYFITLLYHELSPIVLCSVPYRLQCGDVVGSTGGISQHVLYDWIAIVRITSRDTISCLSSKLTHDNHTFNDSMLGLWINPGLCLQYVCTLFFTAFVPTTQKYCRYMWKMDKSIFIGCDMRHVC